MQGRNTEALKLLQPVCDQFKESVDVADLRNARALLRCLKHELNQKKPGERFSTRAATPDREYNLNVYGYSCAQTMVAVLTASGDDLTRENVMKQAASIHNEKLPMLLPGITISTSADDFAPIKQMQLEKFDGTNWKLFGELLSGSNS
jgi:hypothetical protein